MISKSSFKQTIKIDNYLYLLIWKKILIIIIIRSIIFVKNKKKIQGANKIQKDSILEGSWQQ